MISIKQAFLPSRRRESAPSESWSCSAAPHRTQNRGLTLPLTVVATVPSTMSESCTPAMNETQTSPAHRLLEIGTLVRFRVADTHTQLSPDKENVFVRAELVFTDDDEDTAPEDIAEWAAFGFLFTLAALSFHDARPRGASGIDYQPNDEFTVADFFDCLSFKYGELRLAACRTFAVSGGGGAR